MPVESGVAPAGPSATAVPVLAPSGGSFGTPSFGSAADLRGALPLLPAPVPGLLGPALNFVGNAPEAAAAHPKGDTAQAAPAPATARQGRAADTTPALPTKPSPGAPSTAISVDRKSAASTPGNGLSLSRVRGDEAASNPLVEPSALEHARPEKAAGLGRRFRRAMIGPRRARGRCGCAGRFLRGALRSSRRRSRRRVRAGLRCKAIFSPRSAGAALGAGRPANLRFVRGGDLATLSPPCRSATPGAGAISFFHSASPNEPSASPVPLSFGSGFRVRSPDRRVQA